MNGVEFQQYRSFLFAIAYRMLGSVTDAEDMVQETFLRWQQRRVTVRSPKAYLATIITRLCIDYLRSARVQREQYIGPWLPEPLETHFNPAEQVELADSLSTAFLVLLEKLSPTERAVFLLREVFDFNYAEIEQIVGKSATNCRQILRRARQHLASRQGDVKPIEHRHLVEQFLQAWTEGDLPGLLKLMATDVTLLSDGGGKVVAALKPLYGDMKVARFLIAIRRHKVLPTFTSRLTQVNGQSALVNYADGCLHSTMTFDMSGDRLGSIFAVANPEKLKSIH